MDAELITNRLPQGGKFDGKNGAVTRSGELEAKTQRGQAEKAAFAVLIVNMVVNELVIKNP